MKHTRHQIQEAIDYWTKVLNETVADDIENFRKNPPGNAGIQGTIGQILHDNMHKFNTCKTVFDVIQLCKKLFVGIPAQQTNWIFNSLRSKKNVVDALLVINSVYQRECGFSMNMDAEEKKHRRADKRIRVPVQVTYDDVFPSKKG